MSTPPLSAYRANLATISIRSPPPAARVVVSSSNGECIKTEISEATDEKLPPSRGTLSPLHQTILKEEVVRVSIKGSPPPPLEQHLTLSSLTSGVVGPVFNYSQQHLSHQQAPRQGSAMQNCDDNTKTLSNDNNALASEQEREICIKPLKVFVKAHFAHLFSYF